ncbi:MAG: aminotransferase class V-fold PLP-dependent enzyme [Proteobacteria bacterium]|nr:aminotransferase class V-fold PLP-dependent enzyme [Pseudomonadota bacterium]MDA1071697.1 aminotransferase class V-fold PLP-dependent enzyme [Pseudomonadota bacterium]
MAQEETNRVFAEQGRDARTLFAEMDAIASADQRWDDPRNLKASYWAGDDVVAVMHEAYARHVDDNAIYGASLFPSLVRYEAEVVAMALDMLEAPEGAAGGITTGGTESILMAVRTARDWARIHRPGAAHPEIILPETAHPAFEKAAQVVGMAVVRMTRSPDWRADVAAMEAAIGANTVMLVGSAPPYPYGIVDPIAGIAALAVAHGLWMHVDGCIGGFLLPFLADLGEPVPPFDFRVPGVDSISADLHKFGYSGRGASLLLLRERANEDFQRFSSDAWPSGTYSTLNFGGSRNGGAIASSWAVMRYLGRAGYRERVAAIVATKRAIAEGLAADGRLAVLGRPEGANICIVSDTLDMVAVAEGLDEKGWLTGRLQRPAGLLLLITPRHAGIEGSLLADLRAVADEVASGRRSARGSQAVYVG